MVVIDVTVPRADRLVANRYSGKNTGQSDSIN